MAILKPLPIEELNNLYKECLSQKAEFKKVDEIKRLFGIIRSQGYSIIILRLDHPSSEFSILSEEGKKAFKKWRLIGRKKMKARIRHEYELVADLRELERKLGKQILDDFFQSTGNNYFVVAKTYHDIVFFNDPDNLLTELFK